MNCHVELCISLKQDYQLLIIIFLVVNCIKHYTNIILFEGVKKSIKQWEGEGVGGRVITDYNTESE